MNNTLVKLMGWKAILLQADPTVTDRWRWLKRHIQPGLKRTLDAGCGQGQFTMGCAQLGNKSVGLAFSSQDIQTAQTRASLLSLANVEFRAVDLRYLDKYTAELGTFDQILLLETLEHILNDTKVLFDLFDLLRPGGIILVTVPSADHHPLWGERVSDYEDGGHVRWGYSHEELTKLFRDCGLEVTSQEYVSGVVSQKLASLQFGLRQFNPLLSWGLTLPLRVFHFLDKPLTKLLAYPYLSVAVVGRKPS